MLPRIALIHAVTVAMEPVQEAFRRLWPEASCTNLLEELAEPRSRAGRRPDGCHDQADYDADQLQC